MIGPHVTGGAGFDRDGRDGFSIGDAGLMRLPGHAQQPV